MQLPIMSVAPVVKNHAEVFKDVFTNRRQFLHFQNYLTGLIVLDNKGLTNIARCILDSADKTNLSRFFLGSTVAREQGQRASHRVLVGIDNRRSA